MPVALLDACVLYPVTLRDVLLRAAELGLYQVRWSPLILDEMKRNIQKNRPDLSDEQLEGLVATMKRAFPEAEVSGFDDLTEIMRNDHGDRHVLAAAVIAEAEVIVTSNVKHFPSKACEPYSIETLSPDEFLCYLLDAYPEAIEAVISSASADTVRPHLSENEILQALSTVAPVFAERLAPGYE